MPNETKNRKASDVLLDLERKIDLLQNTVNSLSLDIRLLIQRTAIKNIPVVSPSTDNEKKAGGVVVAPVQEITNVLVTNSCLYHEDKKPIRLAKVKILNSNNEVIVNCMTNHVGVWTASLRPGIYSVKLEKGAIASKNARTYEYKIEITTGDYPHKELPVIII